jgi:hypothetical protein
LTIAVFGDSVTFGQGVPANLTFPAQLEEQLYRANLSAKVLNFGVQGHTLEMIVAHLADRFPQLHPEVVVLAFIGDDLSTTRAQNRVDRFGYLTKNVFGPPSFWSDLARAIARKSHFALLTKDALLRLQVVRQSQQKQDANSNTDSDLEQKLDRFRKAIARFENLVTDVKRIVICLDLHETPLTRSVANIMRSEFPNLIYVHAPQVLDQLPPETLRVPRDGHPNTKAHKIYAELLSPFLIQEVQILHAPPKGAWHRSHAESLAQTGKYLIFPFREFSQARRGFASSLS